MTGEAGFGRGGLLDCFVFPVIVRDKEKLVVRYSPGHYKGYFSLSLHEAKQP